MNKEKLTQWTQVLEKITANIVPETAKETADFVFAVSQKLIESLVSEKDKAAFIPKILPTLKIIQPILESGDLSAFSSVSATYTKKDWEETAAKIEKLKDGQTATDCDSFTLFIRSKFGDGEYEKMPVLFCIFSKIDTTMKVFEAIRKVKPKKLYVSSDCWRQDKIGEKEKVEYLREAVLHGVDWDCEVFTKFSEENQGCRRAIEGGLDWFFDNEEMGIILEDDTLPSPDFFRFCSEMLIKYKDDERVFVVKGHNENATKTSCNSYYFKDDVGASEMWGWATWRRVWLKNDKKAPQFEEYQKICREYVDGCDFDKHIKIMRMKFILAQLQGILNGTINSWSYVLKFTTAVHGGLFVLCDSNLVTNIGCTSQAAAHTSSKFYLEGTLPTGVLLFPLEHPENVATRPLTAQEYINTYVPRFCTLDFLDNEAKTLDGFFGVQGFLRKHAFFNNPSVMHVYQETENLTIFTLFNDAVNFRDSYRAQKYLYLGLCQSAFHGETNFCARCAKTPCLSVCPTKSISLNKRENGETVAAIEQRTCAFCWKCAKICPVANPA